MNQHNFFKRSSGFTIIEVLIVMSVIGAMTAGAYVLASYATQETRTNDFMQKLGKMNIGIRSEIGAMYERATTQNMIALGILPEEWKVTSTTAKHPFGGALAITAVFGPPRTAWMVAMTNVEQSLCTTLFSNYTLLPTTLSIQIGAIPKWNKADGALGIKDYDGFCGTAATRTVRIEVIHHAS